MQCLGGADLNSVGKQLNRMLWNAASFRVINEARSIAPTDEEGENKLNGLEHQAINDGFFAYQLLAMRRLGDTYPIDGPRGVFSLTGLLEDIKKHFHLFTRHNLIAVETADPDYPRFYVSVRHEQIDQLTGVERPARTDADAIPVWVIEGLQSRIKEASRELHQYADQYIAHAATPQSRSHRKSDELKITLQHVYHAHQVLCETANFVGIWMLGKNRVTSLAIPQYDQFEYMDQPLVNSANIPVLGEVWRNFEKETHAWGNWGYRHLKTELTKS